VRATLAELVDYLRQRGLALYLEEQAAAAHPELHLPCASLETIGTQCELAIVIGGDGTLLQAARSLARYPILLLGIKLGRLGFLTDITPEAMRCHLDEILAGHYTREKRFLLDVEVQRGERVIAKSNALNDVVIHKWNTSRMFSFTTQVNDRAVCSQRADGLIISTPTGSTAYALSCGGPILHPALNILLLISICPHTLSNRPLVIDGDSCVCVIIHADRLVEAQLSCDGEVCQTLQPEDCVHIRKGAIIELVHPPAHDYYATLRTKLNWGKLA